MENLNTYITEILILLFILITFLQSGVDKMMDWNGNTGWLKEHFAKTFLAGMVPLMVGIILVIEVLVGLLAIAGIYTLISNGDSGLGLLASILACVTLLMLLFGQRVAKDYAGAFTLTGYFIVCILGVWMMN